MRLRRRMLALASMALPGMLVFALPMLAAEDAAPNPADSPAGLIFRWINFALVFGGIAYLIAKHGGAFFSANARAISASIREGTAAKEEADRQLQEVEAKISHLNQEVTAMEESARRDSLAETERLNASGQAEIEKIQVAARAELSATERAARQELRALAASLAVERAGELVASRMDNNIRSRLMRSFLAELERSAN
jgi:F0F1-type ATP synthase membrane subunit b/b'